MFREMRRKRQAISLEESIAVLMRGTSGVLAVSGDNGYPYAVPISYAYYGTNAIKISKKRTPGTSGKTVLGGIFLYCFVWDIAQTAAVFP